MVGIITTTNISGTRKAFFLPLCGDDDVFFAFTAASFGVRDGGAGGGENFARGVDGGIIEAVQLGQRSGLPPLGVAAARAARGFFSRLFLARLLQTGIDLPIKPPYAAPHERVPGVVAV